MAREYTRAVLHLSCDERLVSGVGGAVAYFAERAGLAGRSRDSLVTALEEFCLDALPLIEGTDDPLDVTIEDFEDRIEIVVQHRGQTATAAAGRTAPERVALRMLSQVVDRIECDARNGSVRTTLVKYF